MSRIMVRGSQRFESPPVHSDFKSHDLHRKAKNRSDRWQGSTIFFTFRQVSNRAIQSESNLESLALRDSNRAIRDIQAGWPRNRTGTGTRETERGTGTVGTVFQEPKPEPSSGVNKSARERIGCQNLSQKVPSKKGSLGVIFSPRNDRENAHSKSANFEGRHSGGHLLGRPLLFTSDIPFSEI